ncbi:MAG: hypothetical protein II008_22700 [Oscillospiraceae bacterium]|nr:hypothetical protein [Oscillospiraceae bacterium]
MKTERELKLEWLNRSKPLRLRLIGLRAERQERLSRADYAGIGYGERSSGNGGNGMEGKYLALVETEAELDAVQKELDRVEAEIRAAIEHVQNPLYQMYLRMRFLAYKTERQISEETGYKFKYIDTHIRPKAIDSVKMGVNEC